MEKVAFLHFHRNISAVIRKVRQGKSLILTYRGEPVMRPEPVQARIARTDDPLYEISELAVPHERSPGESSLTNEEIDAIVYKG